MNYRRHIKQPRYIAKIFNFRLSKPLKIYWFALYFLFLFIQYTFLIWLLPIYSNFGGILTRTSMSLLVFPIGMTYLCEKIKLDGKHIFDYLKDMFFFLRYFLVLRKRVNGYELATRKKSRIVLTVGTWKEETIAC